MGFKLDIWGFFTFATIFVLVVGAVALVVFLMGLPGRIAIARKHPDAEAINMMGWLGFLAVVPWMTAFIWAFKPTTIIDIRRTPAGEKGSNRRNNRPHERQAYPGRTQTTKAGRG